MLKWLRSLFPRRFETPWRVEVNEERITTSFGQGDVRHIAISDLRRVVIVTDDSGPWGDDLIYFLLGESEEPVACFPLGAHGENEFVTWLVRQPGSDEKEIIRAMGSTRDARFLIYERP